MTTESRIKRAIRLALGDAEDVLLYDNPVGYDEGRRIRYGLCKGSSDLIGIGPDGRFLAIEVKSPRGRLTDEQRMFIELVRARSGVAFVARSAEEAMERIEDERR